jgi:hypothetical protein
MDPTERMLYISDTGGNRVLRVNPDSGHFLRNAKWEFPIYSSIAETFEYTIWGCTKEDVFAEGIEDPSPVGHVRGRQLRVRGRAQHWARAGVRQGGDAACERVRDGDDRAGRARDGRRGPAALRRRPDEHGVVARGRWRVWLAGPRLRAG